GLDGQQGVLLPRRNLRHLMLEPAVVDAVATGHFHIYTASHAGEGLALLTGMPSGIDDPVTTQGPYPSGSVLSRCEAQLRQFREACRAATRGMQGGCP